MVIMNSILNMFMKLWKVIDRNIWSKMMFNMVVVSISEPEAKFTALNGSTVFKNTSLLAVAKKMFWKLDNIVKWLCNK